MLKILLKLIKSANNKFRKKILKMNNLFNNILTNKIKLDNYKEFKFKIISNLNNYPFFPKIRKIKIKWT
jgi:hypothetical protein